MTLALEEVAVTAGAPAGAGGTEGPCISETF